jgi:hypothetical protein
MDWPYVYATVARNAGWTYRKIGKQPACDIFALLEDIADHPPSYLIDAAVHLKAKPKRGALSPQKAEEARETVSKMFGPAQKLPADLLALVEWSESFGKPKKS